MYRFPVDDGYIFFLCTRIYALFFFGSTEEALLRAQTIIIRYVTDGRNKDKRCSPHPALNTGCTSYCCGRRFYLRRLPIGPLNPFTLKQYLHITCLHVSKTYALSLLRVQHLNNIKANPSITLCRNAATMPFYISPAGFEAKSVFLYIKKKNNLPTKQN